MALLKIDTEKCKRDGICVDECPARIIELGSDFPFAIDGAEELCIDCGHCVAVCPHGALSHRSMSPEQCPPVKKEWLLRRDHAEHFLRSRRSIRTYKSRMVEKTKLANLIQIARYAPSGHNAQPLEWTVLSGRENIREYIGHVIEWMKFMIKEQPRAAEVLHLDRVIEAWGTGIDTVCWDAPHVVLVHADKSNMMAQGAASPALSYLELAAQPMGLGACWAGYFHAAAMFWPSLQKALDLPESHGCLGAMMVGYPKYSYHRLPLRNEPVIHWK